MSWYSLSKNEVETSVTVFGEIGAGGVTAAAFLKSIESVRGTLRISINSPGGDAFDSLAIFNGLIRHPAKKLVSIDGLAASGGSIIAMAGNRISIASNAFYMIHDVHARVVGNADGFRKEAGTLDMMSQKIAETYASRGGASVSRFRELMKAETWLNAEQSVELHLADEISGAVVIDKSRMAASLSNFRNTPAEFRLDGGASNAESRESEYRRDYAANAIKYRRMGYRDADEFVRDQLAGDRAGPVKMHGVGGVTR